MLDWSYCCIAINHFKVIQHENKTAKVYDKLGNLIFDGTNLGAGTFSFVCSKEPLTDFSITLDNSEVVTFADYKMTRVYTGENEKWTVTKETTVELPVV